MTSHRHVPVMLLKLTMTEDFHDWCNVRGVNMSNDNLIEFLIQRGFLKGKRFREYCDEIKISPTWHEFSRMQPLREGFLPPDTLI